MNASPTITEQHVDTAMEQQPDARERAEQQVVKQRVGDICRDCGREMITLDTTNVMGLCPRCNGVEQQ